MINVAQPSPAKNPEFTQDFVEPEPPKKSSKWLVVVVILLLLSSTSIFAYKYYQLKQQLSQTQTTSTPLVEASPTADPTTLEFIDPQPISDLPDEWTYFNFSACNVNLPLPPIDPDIDNRTWQTETPFAFDFLDFFKGNAISVIHRNLEEASGYISGIVTVACGPTSDTLATLNSDFIANLDLQASQNPDPDFLIKINSNQDSTMWGMSVKEMTFTGGMFDSTQKHYLFINSDKWYLITQKSMSTNSEINQQTNQIFDLLKFTK